MQVEQLTYTIAGLSPLLLNNPRGMLAQSGAAPARQKRIPSPEEEAEGGTYRTAEGVIAVPAIAVRNAMITAAAGFKYKTRSWKGFVSHIEVRPAELLPLYDSQDAPVTTYEIDLRRAVIKGRGAVARARPMIRDWRATFTFVADTEMLPTYDPRGCSGASSWTPARGSGSATTGRRRRAGSAASPSSNDSQLSRHGAASHAAAWPRQARHGTDSYGSFP